MPVSKPSTTATPVKVETVTLRQLAESLSESHELPKKQVMSMLEEMVTTVTKHLKRGARIRIGGLGILQVRKRPARMGRNPATGEAIKIKASKRIAFRVAQDLRAAITGLPGDEGIGPPLPSRPSPRPKKRRT